MPIHIPSVLTRADTFSCLKKQLTILILFEIDNFDVVAMAEGYALHSGGPPWSILMTKMDVFSK